MSIGRYHIEKKKLHLKKLSLSPVHFALIARPAGARA